MPKFEACVHADVIRHDGQPFAAAFECDHFATGSPRQFHSQDAGKTTQPKSDAYNALQTAKSG